MNEKQIIEILREFKGEIVKLKEENGLLNQENEKVKKEIVKLKEENESLLKQKKKYKKKSISLFDTLLAVIVVFFIFLQIYIIFF